MPDKPYVSSLRTDHEPGYDTVVLGKQVPPFPKSSWYCWGMKTIPESQPPVNRAKRRYRKRPIFKSSGYVSDVINGKRAHQQGACPEAGRFLRGVHVTVHLRLDVDAAAGVSGATSGWHVAREKRASWEGNGQRGTRIGCFHLLDNVSCNNKVTCTRAIALGL